MTAPNLFVTPDAAYLLADCASFFVSTGAVASIHSKIVENSPLRVAIGTEGWIPSNGYARLRQFLSECVSQDQLLPGVAALASEFAVQGLPAGDPYPADGNLLVALYSLERRRCEAWHVPVRHESGFFPVGMHARPHVRNVSWRDFGTGGRRKTIRQARELIDAQRSFTDDRGLHFVGGGGELATVTASGVDCRMVRWWRRDRVGRPVRPSRLDRFF